MCGIIGYTGARDASAVIIKALCALEYRGYDSAGLTVDAGGELKTVKCAGRLTSLAEKVKVEHPGEARVGIGHTRWATHGAPTDINAHPHFGRGVRLVHNGIIENFAELKADLLSRGCSFTGDTDTEVAAVLLGVDLERTGDPRKAIAATVAALTGSYAFAVMFECDPGAVYGIRRESPLIVGLGEGEAFIASDITAILPYTRRFIRLPADALTVIRDGRATVSSLDGTPLDLPEETAEWSYEEAERGGCEHFMQKEIKEEPDVLRATIRPRIKNGVPDFSTDNINCEILKKARRLYIVGCGTAMHAGLIARTLFEEHARLPVSVEIASEFRYCDPIIGADDIVILISQSGETADTLAALRLAKEKGAYTLAVVNVTGSAIAREADGVLYTRAGPEIAVASTKAYSTQTALLALLAVKTASLRGLADIKKTKDLTARLIEAEESVASVAERGDEIRAIASIISKKEDVFFIGRGVDYCLAEEGSLKLKEISYIHSEAYPAGELKHGTISLIERDTPVIALASDKRLLHKTLSNLHETGARGSDTILVGDGDAVNDGDAAHVFALPACGGGFGFLPMATFMQTLAYETAKLRGTDIDKPRNLAKSVTVE